MPEQTLQRVHVDTRLKKIRDECVTQQVHPTGLVDPRALFGVGRQRFLVRPAFDL